MLKYTNGHQSYYFDWGRTLFDSETKKEFPEADTLLSYCVNKGYKIAVASLVSVHANATLPERIDQIRSSSLRKYFNLFEVTDTEKDIILDSLVSKLGLPRKQILIVDDRMIRGIKYGIQHGHPTVWFQNGKFADQTLNENTGKPDFIVNSLDEIINII